jgi:hypothetical protein
MSPLRRTLTAVNTAPRVPCEQRFERKGHAFVDLTASYLVDDRPLALVHHRALWRPRLADADGS